MKEPSELLKNELIKFYLDKVIEKINPEKVILFGSYAEGKENKYADVDFAIIKSEFYDTTEIYGAIDLIDYNKANAGLKEKIDKTGIILYERNA